ncbi:LarC family nickel insertion protein [Desulfosporosinus fructosivorans]|uniref:LarC family nickel insertion protein n=1 Tax=Desulfosporosinus fructosivorans TaxID=2018669 RepID=A0A4Z0R1P2_9FIRM|nr:LarC family nickel insertion protein [Desulfosporosinus fructosivorans]TGE36992.1 LarC family nickel insertion protein [Desulfosporosinus fructosivorans]
MRILYWDTFAGISGDMALGSLIALGADPELIVEQLHSIGLTEFVLDVQSRQVHGIQATDIDVVIPMINHEHDGHHEGHEHDGHHTRDEPHAHHDHFEVQKKEPKDHHRRLPDITKMILSGTLSERSIKRALAVFNVLAEAEAHVHGTTVDQVHFHEVGAVDSLVDIVGTCIALDQLDIDLIRVSTLPWSHGFVNCAHGILPLPAPATLMLLRGFKFQESGITGELITPTGAALMRALAEQATFPEMTLLSVGYGAGKNDYGIPSLLRGVLGEI